MTDAAAFIDAQARLLAESGSDATSRFVTLGTPAMRVHVLEAGRGAPVVMIHGGNSVAAAWERLFAALQDDVHVFAPDRPGCGLTDGVDYRRVLSFRDHSLAFLDALLDALGLARVSLIGNSIGGWWSLAYALAHPERVERIVCLGEPAASGSRIQARHRILATPGLNALLYATALRPRRNSMRAQLRGLVAHPERLSEAFLDLAYAAATLPGARIAWTSMIERFVSGFSAPCGTFAMREQLRALPHPVLFVWGDRDGCPPRWGAELCRYLPAASLEVLPDAGHLPWLDEPARVAELVRAFLRR
ncbi:MAG: alpha/beta fold hydrolase [Chloroflexota bacterium]|nr:alpha/beta fold hydrolase [Chloroflexota bacterium]